MERRIGNRDNEDMNGPEWNWCGMCDVRMVALACRRPDEVPTLDDMYRDAFGRGVYRMVDGDVIGAFHRELADYARRQFSFARSRAARGLSADAVADTVYAERPEYVIASVSPQIRNLEGPPPEKKGGHLVLVYDVETTEEGRFFVLHNSSGFASTGTQRAARVSEKRFVECFSGNAIIISD